MQFEIKLIPGTESDLHLRRLWVECASFPIRLRGTDDTGIEHWIEGFAIRVVARVVRPSYVLYVLKGDE